MAGKKNERKKKEKHIAPKILFSEKTMFDRDIRGFNDKEVVAAPPLSVVSRIF